MERKLRSLTEQMNTSRSNYDRILGRTAKTVKNIITEQDTLSDGSYVGYGCGAVCK